jgi:hypothetical protein
MTRFVVGNNQHERTVGGSAGDNRQRFSRCVLMLVIPTLEPRAHRRIPLFAGLSITPPFFPKREP